MEMVDVTIHIDRTLDSNQRAKIADALRARKGVMGVATHDDKPHLMIVSYDPDQTTSKELLQGVIDMGGRAQLIGV